MNNEFVSVPRDQLGELIDGDFRQQGSARNKLRALLAKPAAQHQGEPVEFDFPEFHAQGMGCGLEDSGITDRYEAMRYGFDEAIDQFATILQGIGPLYTQADTGDILYAAQMLAISKNECDRLRAQLAERDALLRDVRRRIQSERWGWESGLVGRIDSALSAIAEPSAPKCKHCGDTGQIMVGRSGDASDGNAPIMEPCEDCDHGAPIERNEKADFETAYAHAVESGWSNVKHLARLMWMTRAAMERKP